MTTQERARMNIHRLPLAALLVAAASVLLSCTEPGPAAPDLGGKALEPSVNGSSGGLLQCRPLAYDSVTQVIGPGGGEIRISRHTLAIPGGALKERTAITVVAPSDTVNRLQFAPEGLTFNKPVALVMSYANCTTDGPAKEIAYVDDNLNIIGHQPSKDDPAGKRVGGLLTHFSQYAVSW